MLANFFESRLGGGFKTHSPRETAEISARMGQMSKARRDAADALAGGRSVLYNGRRLDSRSLGEAAGKRERAMSALLSGDHLADPGSVLGRAAIVDREEALRSGRRADSAIPMASQALASIYKQIYDIEHAELAAWSGMICKIDTQVDPAAEQYVWYERDIAGVPRTGSTYDVSTIPMVVGPVGAQNTGYIVPALVGWETNFMEGRRSALGVRNGKPDFQIDAGKIETCKTAIAQFFDALWLYGDASMQIDGLHSSPYVSNAPVSAGAWSGLTTAGLIAELNSIFNLPANQTQGRLGDMRRVKFFCPPAQYDIITRPTVQAAGLASFSAWKSFAESKGLTDKNLVKVHQLAAANSAVYTGGPLGLAVDTAYIIYEKGDMWDPHFVLSQPIEVPAAPRMTGVGEVMYMHARGGGIRIADAQRIFRYEGL